MSKNTKIEKELIKKGNMYYDNEGILRCSRCNDAVQILLDIGLDKPIVQHKYCSCAHEAYAAKQHAASKAIEALQIERRRNECFVNSQMYKDVRFDNLTSTNPLLQARDYANDFRSMLESGTSLFIHGPAKTHKTSTAAAVANAVIDSGFSVYFTNSTAITTVRNTFQLDPILYKVDLLIIDDLLITGDNCNRLALYHLIHSRYESKRPMLVTIDARISSPLDATLTMDRKILADLWSRSHIIAFEK